MLFDVGNTEDIVKAELMSSKPSSRSPVDGLNQASADSGNGSDHAQYPEDQSPRTMSTASGISCCQAKYSLLFTWEFIS